MVPNPQNTTTTRLHRTEPGAKRVKAEVLKSTTPSNFGYAQPRSQDLFEEEQDSTPRSSSKETSLGGLGFQETFRGNPGTSGDRYEDNVLFVHHNHRGLRLSLQANAKVAMVAFVIIVVLIALPIISELLGVISRFGLR